MKTKRFQSLLLFSKLPETKASLGFLPFFLSFIISIASTFAWKSTDMDFASKIGTKYLSVAYIVIACILVCSGFFIAILRKNRSPERVFIRIQQISWSLFLLLWLFEIQYHFSATIPGLFALKVLGHAYSSITILSFCIMYDPYDPTSRISKNCYTLLQVAKYLGVAFCGTIFNLIPLQGTAHFIPLIGSLSFIVWLLANFCHPLALYEILPKQTLVPTPPEPLEKKKKVSRAAFFLITGSILLNALAGSSEYAVILDFESNFLSANSQHSSEIIGQFITLFGIGNLLAFISCSIWYSVRLSSFGLMGLGGTLLFLIPFGEKILLTFPFLNKFLAFGMDPSMLSAICTLFIVESLYPVVVQSNMMNVLAALSSSTQRKARVIIESASEAIGLGVGIMIVEAASTPLLPTAIMSLSLCALSGFLFFREKRYPNLSIDSETEDSSADEIDARISQLSLRQKTPFSFDSPFFDTLLDEPLFRFYDTSLSEEAESRQDIMAI